MVMLSELNTRHLKYKKNNSMELKRMKLREIDFCVKNLWVKIGTLQRKKSKIFGIVANKVMERHF